MGLSENGVPLIPPEYYTFSHKIAFFAVCIYIYRYKCRDIHLTIPPVAQHKIPSTHFISIDGIPSGK